MAPNPAPCGGAGEEVATAGAGAGEEAGTAGEREAAGGAGGA